MKSELNYDIPNDRKCIFCEILSFLNALKCMVPQLSSMNLIISNRSRNILSSKVPITNFIMFFDICERYKTTIYEWYPTHNTSAQIFDREMTGYDLNIKKYHSTFF